MKPEPYKPQYQYQTNREHRLNVSGAPLLMQTDAQILFFLLTHGGFTFDIVE